MNDAAIEKVTDHLTEVLDACAIAHVQGLPAMKQAIALATGVKAMRAALTDEIVGKLLMPLQGSSLGFRTDKDAGQGYPIEVVRDCAIEALVRGFQVVGNEFNIIAGRAYFTKEGFERRVREFPGVSDLEFEPGVPHMASGGALVPYRASWKLHGVPMELVRDQVKRADGEVVDQRIPVRANQGMGADAILGKAKRKMLAHVLERLAGARFMPADGDVLDTVGVSVPSLPPPGVANEGRRIKIGKSEAAPEREPGSDG